MTDTIQTLVDEPTIDYNALDDTFGGQCIQAAYILAAASVPDFTTRKALAWTLLGAANLATIAAFNAFDEDPRNDLTAVLESEQGEAESIATTWLTIGGIAVAAVGAFAAGVQAQKKLAGWLGRRGVAKPNVAIGTVAALAYLGAKQL